MMEPSIRDNEWITRIRRPTKEELASRYFHLRTPFIITGGMDEWSALSTWNERSIRALMGEEVVRVRHCNLPDERPRTYDRVTVNEALGRKLYVSIVDPLGKYPYLAKDVAVPYFVPNDPSPAEPWQVPFINLLMGNDPHTGNHYHGTGMAALCLVVGTKRVRFFPPWQSSFLYPKSFFRHLLSEVAEYSSSRVDLRAPNLERYPAFAKAKPLDCVVKAGEILCIPPSWWHTVDGEGFCASFTYFWHLPEGRWKHVTFPSPGIRAYAIERLLPVVQPGAKVVQASIPVIRDTVRKLRVVMR